MALQVDYLARPHQLRVMQSTKTFIFMGCGVGAGKTDVGSLWSLGKIAQNPHSAQGLIAANTYSQLIDATAKNVLKNWTAWGIPFRPRNLPRNPRPFSLEVCVNGGWSPVLFRSLDSADTLSGIEVAWWWADEVWGTTRGAIDILTARLRQKEAALLQGLMTTTLDEPTTWMHERFVERFDPAIMDVIYATTYDNEPNLPEGYIARLKATYSPRLFDRMVLAKWVSLEEGKIYYAFDRQRHVDESIALVPERPLLWAHDFNIGAGKPMSSCLCQIVRREGRLHLQAVDEIILDTADTTDAAKEFTGRYGQHPGGVIVYGDAAGRARDSRSHTTDYGILAAAGYGAQKVPPANPPVRDRHNAVNSLLLNSAGEVRLTIHPRCKTLLKGLETVRLKPGAQYVEQETREQHVTTALGYLVAQEFPVSPRATLTPKGNWK